MWIDGWMKRVTEVYLTYGVKEKYQYVSPFLHIQQNTHTHTHSLFCTRFLFIFFLLNILSWKIVLLTVFFLFLPLLTKHHTSLPFHKTFSLHIYMYINFKHRNFFNDDEWKVRKKKKMKEKCSGFEQTLQHGRIKMIKRSLILKDHHFCLSNRYTSSM